MSVVGMHWAVDSAPNTATRMQKDNEVTMTVIEKICDVVDAFWRDIVEYGKIAFTEVPNVKR